jgi:ATP-dependent protease ClpP protease subunit
MTPLYLCGDVDEVMAGRVFSALDEGVDSIILNSEGGGIYSAFAIFDALIRRDVTITATGKCMSAAVVVLLGGKHRYATPHCRFLTHPVSMTGDEPSKADVNEVSFLGFEVADIIHARGCISLPKARALLATENYFGSPYAKTIGNIDDIWQGEALAAPGFNQP